MNALKHATILVIDDDSISLFLLNAALKSECKELILQSDSHLGLESARDKQPSLILLDIMMDKIDGYRICTQLKSDTKTQHIPVIFLSSLMQSEDKVKGFMAGGVDYICKPFDIDELIARIKSCLTTHQKIQQSTHSDSESLLQYLFNKREIEVLRLYILGHKRSEIASKTYLSENTVKWYVKQIFQKLEVNNRAALIEKMRGLGF